MLLCSVEWDKPPKRNIACSHVPAKQDRTAATCNCCHSASFIHVHVLLDLKHKKKISLLFLTPIEWEIQVDTWLAKKQTHMTQPNRSLTMMCYILGGTLPLRRCSTASESPARGEMCLCGGKLMVIFLQQAQCHLVALILSHLQDLPSLLLSLGPLLATAPHCSPAVRRVERSLVLGLL